MSEDQVESEAEAGNARRAGGSLSLGRLIPILILLAGLGAFFLFDLHQYVTADALKQHREALRAWVADYGVWSVVIFGVIYLLVAAFSIPGGAVLTVAGGFLFGPYVATLCIVIGATLGAMTLFLAARYAIADLLRAKAGPFLGKIEQGFNEDGMSYMFILRLVPLFPFWLVNLAPAFLGVPLRTFAVSTFIGIIPGTFVYALVGDGAGAVFDQGGDIDFGIISEPRVLAPIVGLIVLAFVPVVYKRLRARKARQGTGHHGGTA